MKNYHFRIFAMAAMIVLIGTFSACKKDNPTPITTTDPTPVLAFTAGPYECAVGSSTPCEWTANTSITAGGAITYSISNTSIATINVTTGVITPIAAGTATVTATQAAKAGKNVAATATYALTITGLSITSFTPDNGGVGYSVTITGTQFDLTPANNVVTICGVQTATPTSVTATSLTVLVPKGASGPGDIKVTVGLQTASKGTFTEYATVTTLAGDGTQGYFDATGLSAKFFDPSGLVIDKSGNLLVADEANNVIRSINVTTGVVTTLAGDGSYSETDGKGTAAAFDGPYGLTISPTTGVVYVVDRDGDRIRAIDANTNVTTIAGTDEGDSDGNNLTAAQFDQPQGIAIDAFGNLYITDYWNSLIREVVTGGYVNTIAGNGLSNYVNGNGRNAGFYFPDGIVVAPDGNSLFIADATNNAIRKLTIQGSIDATTFAGTSSTGTSTGSVDGTGTAARFNQPSGLVFDANGNLYVTDSGNGLIRKITPAGVVTTIAGTADSSTLWMDGLGPNSRFYEPSGIAIDADGNLYVSDGTNRIRKIVP